MSLLVRKLSKTRGLAAFVLALRDEMHGGPVAAVLGTVLPRRLGQDGLTRFPFAAEQIWRRWVGA